MPQWLTEKTGLTHWPETQPPYIYEPFHNLNTLPKVAHRYLGQCDSVSTSSCSYDCHECTAREDITQCHVLSQTFDDGPSAATPELLNYLKWKRQKTTFFLIGLNVVEFPDIVRRELREGHLLAVHTWSHQFLPSLTNEEVFAELQWCIWAINATTGYTPKYFRPPYGGVDNRIRAIAKTLKLKTVIWDHDTKDWELNVGSRRAEDVLNDVTKWNTQFLQPNGRSIKRGRPKGLILEHDFSMANVELAKKISSKIKHKQKRVDQCR